MAPQSPLTESSFERADPNRMAVMSGSAHRPRHLTAMVTSKQVTITRQQPRAHPTYNCPLTPRTCPAWLHTLAVATSWARAAIVSGLPYHTCSLWAGTSLMRHSSCAGHRRHRQGERTDANAWLRGAIWSICPLTRLRHTSWTREGTSVARVETVGVQNTCPERVD